MPSIINGRTTRNAKRGGINASIDLKIRARKKPKNIPIHLEHTGDLKPKKLIDRS